MKVGIDLVYLSRFEKVNKHFIDRVLTENEMKIYQSLTKEKKIEFLAGRWAAKEAIFKALNCPDYLHYSILNHDNGAPFVENHPEISISISHERDYACAMVMVNEIIANLK